MKTVLITIFYADGLHGGVKYTAEIGNYLHSLGYTVFCVGALTNEITKRFFAKNNVKLFNVFEFPVDKHIDIVWAHHWPILPYLIRKGLKYKKLINSCISKILPIDKPVFFSASVDLFLTLTEKTKHMFINEYDIPEYKIHVLPNTAPDNFFEYSHDYNRTLRSIAVVSNHIPAELTKALEILAQQGYKTIVYGGENPVDIVPEVLAQHDVIISIGKTVQYAMAMGIPVYNYDHFGGSGYITPNNIDVEEAANFSGRSFFTKKTATQITNEIINEYKDVLAKADELKQIAEKRYKTSSKINEVLDILESTPDVPMVIENNTNRLYFDYCEFVINFAARHTNDKITSQKCPHDKGIKRLWRHIRKFKF